MIILLPTCRISPIDFLHSGYLLGHFLHQPFRFKIHFWKNRNLCIPNSKEALLICGESWSTMLLQKVKDAKAKILVVPAHQSVKLHRKADNAFSRMSWHLNFQRFYKESGIPVILTEHTKTPHRHKYAWPSNRTKEVKLPHELSKLFISVYLTEI